MLIIEVYVDDIIFGSDDDMLREEFAKNMENKFKMSLLWELNLLLGLHIIQLSEGIFISQSKYISKMLKKL